jgi:adenylate kinase
MRLVFLGPPGCGKGTQAKLLRERQGAVSVGTGDILRAAVRHCGPLGQKVEPYLKSGQLVPDGLVNDIIDEFFHRADRPTRFVIDGYPRTLTQATWFEAMLHGIGLDLQHAVLFKVTDEEVVRRLGGRRTAEGRADDGDEIVRQRLAIYHASAEDLVRHFGEAGLLREIDATADVETVFRSIVSLAGE